MISRVKTLGLKTAFNKISRRTKFRRLQQPGLSRYHNVGQDIWYTKYEPSLMHGSNAEVLISQVPVIEVQDDIVECTGVEAFGFGHPIVFITLNKRDIKIPSVCKYCGLTYLWKK